MTTHNLIVSRELLEQINEWCCYTEEDADAAFPALRQIGEAVRGLLYAPAQTASPTAAHAAPTYGSMGGQAYADQYKFSAAPAASLGGGLFDWLRDELQAIYDTDHFHATGDGGDSDALIYMASAQEAIDRAQEKFAAPSDVAVREVIAEMREWAWERDIGVAGFAWSCLREWADRLESAIGAKP